MGERLLGGGNDAAMQVHGNTQCSHIKSTQHNYYSLSLMTRSYACMNQKRNKIDMANAEPGFDYEFQVKITPDEQAGINAK